MAGSGRMTSIDAVLQRVLAVDPDDNVTLDFVLDLLTEVQRKKLRYLLIACSTSDFDPGAMAPPLPPSGLIPPTSQNTFNDLLESQFSSQEISEIARALAPHSLRVMQRRLQGGTETRQFAAIGGFLTSGPNAAATYDVRVAKRLGALALSGHDDVNVFVGKTRPTILRSIEKTRDMEESKQVRESLDTQIAQSLMKVLNMTFDEDVVRSLYAHLRPHVHSAGFTRDLGDFFAHPDRDRGKLLTLVAPVVRGLRAAEGGVREGSVTIAALAHTMFTDDLNKELEKLRQQKLPPPVCDALALIVLSALQGAKILLDRRPDGGFADCVTLHLLIEPEKVSLFAHLEPKVVGAPAINFPVVEMPNKVNLPTWMVPPGEPNWPIFRVAFINGKPDVCSMSSPLRVGPEDRVK